MNLSIFLMQNEKNGEWIRNGERKKKKNANVEKAIKCQKNSKHITNISHYIITIEDIILMSDGKKSVPISRWKIAVAVQLFHHRPHSFHIFFFFFTWKIRWYDLHRLKGFNWTSSHYSHAQKNVFERSRINISWSYC